MSRILFAWELGGNLGHLAHQVLLGRLLKARGHECLFAVRDCAAAAVVLGADGFEYLPAPFCSEQERSGQTLSSYADILEVNGYASFELLGSMVAAWQELFVRYRLDALTVEYAPTAVLAAKLSRLPVVRVDTGFGFPPLEEPFPSFRPWLGIPADVVKDKEARMLGFINRLFSQRGLPPFSSLQLALATDTDLLVTVPELDHYPGRRFGRYVGPLCSVGDGIAMSWSAATRKRIFVYLRPCEWLPLVLDALLEFQLDVIAVIPGCADELAARYSGEYFRISGVPVMMSALLPDADLVITQGGHGVASACLLAGVPMLIIPQLIEQLMTANNIEQLGMGLKVIQDQVGAEIAGALARLLKETAFRDHARLLASRYCGYDQETVLQNLADTVESHARRASCTTVDCNYAHVMQPALIGKQLL